jgi:hypothetical protein
METLGLTSRTTAWQGTQKSVAKMFVNESVQRTGNPEYKTGAPRIRQQVGYKGMLVERTSLTETAYASTTRDTSSARPRWPT